MERNRRDREGGVLAAAAELFDLPADIVAGLPRLEMVGSRQLYLEHHTGLLAYTEEQIDANTSSGVLRVRGERPQERYATASRRFVFPWAFSPQITLHWGWKSTACIP